MAVATLIKLSKNTYLNPLGLVIHHVKISSYKDVIGALEVSYSNKTTNNYKQNLFIHTAEEREEFLTWLEATIEASSGNGPLSDPNITKWMK